MYDMIILGGGAAGLNVLPIARELGCRQVLVPATAGALSACGGQFSNIVSDFSISRIAYTAEFPYAAVNEALRSAHSLAESKLGGLAGGTLGGLGLPGL